MGSCFVRNNTIVSVKLNENHKIKKENNINKIVDKRNVPRGSIFQINNENILSVYDMNKKIGTGFFGTVKLAFRKNDCKKLYAVKSIDKLKLTTKNIQNLSREIEALSSLDHPNIIKYFETYNDLKYFHIVTEYLSGGELLERTLKNIHLKEVETANIIYKITSAISHCHARRIVHRDLKPENILFESKKADSDIKIIDFGLSRKFNEDQMNSIVGSPFYVAPEVLDGKYDYQCDIWGIGVIMFFLLSGKLPFYDENKVELFKKIKNDELSFKGESWKNISFDAIKLLMILLSKNPKNRPEAKMILENPWFSNNIKKNYPPHVVDPEILKSITNFKQPLQLMRNIFKIIAKQVKSSEIEEFKKMFLYMDKNKSGTIDLSSWQMNNSVSGNNITITTENNISKNMADRCLNNQLDYSSFIATSLGKKNSLNKEILHQTFKYLDNQNSGFLNVQSFEKALKRSGKFKKIEDIEEMFVESGLSKDSRLDFEDFCDFIEKYL
jgi:calcium-dependent protein kinase